MIHSPVKIWRNQKHIQSLLGKEGTIVTWTMIRVPPNNFTSLAPYPIAVVKFAQGNTITAQVVDYDPNTLKIGNNVKVVLRRITDPSIDGVIPYGIKVVPV